MVKNKGMVSCSRRQAKVVTVGGVKIGGGNPVRIQSMAKADTKDVAAVVRQIKGLQRAGCEIVRVAVKDRISARAIRQIVSRISIPLVADIHFSYRLALAAIENGADKIRLNPGNIFKPDEVRQVASAAKKARIPIRVGVNSGSVLKSPGHRATGPPKSKAKLMARAALNYINLLESFDFYDIIVSIKGSDVLETISAYRQFAAESRYPLHLGVTATGPPAAGAIKSALGIGILLEQGIGDTIRVSLTAPPREEVWAAKAILEGLGLRRFGPELISCPTCGRCEVDLLRIVKRLGKRLAAIRYPLSLTPPKVAVMGCVVNGPGEAKDADLGIAFGRGQGLLFKKGQPLRKVRESSAVEEIVSEMRDA